MASKTVVGHGFCSVKFQHTVLPLIALCERTGVGTPYRNDNENRVSFTKPARPARYLRTACRSAAATATLSALLAASAQCASTKLADLRVATYAVPHTCAMPLHISPSSHSLHFTHFGTDPEHALTASPRGALNNEVSPAWRQPLLIQSIARFEREPPSRSAQFASAASAGLRALTSGIAAVLPGEHLLIFTATMGTRG